MNSTLPNGDLEALAPRIGSATIAQFDVILSELHPGSSARPLVDAARTSIEGGKRFRGYCAWLGSLIITPTPNEHALDLLAGALELYQASALAHDDLIDHADTRRGQPAPHIALADTHRESAWSGQASDFGAAGAVLVGDLLLSAADHTMTRAARRLPAPIGAALLERFTVMHAEVALGQFLDVRAEQLPLLTHAVDIDAALDVATRKSARYSVVHPVALGMIAAGASAREVAGIEKVTTPWGLAFQLRDDDLGVFGDPTVTGKPAGRDLIEGKRTALLALSWTAASASQRHTLAQGVGRNDANEAEVRDMIEVVRATGRAAHEDLISSLVSQGHEALESADLSPRALALLEDLGQRLTVRQA